MQEISQENLININYWKEIHREFPEILNNIKGIVLLAHDSIEFTDIIDILNKMKVDHLTNVLYISLVRSYNFMKLVLLHKTLENKRIFFIDCVSGYAFPATDNIDDCLYHKPPFNLTDMKRIINYGIEKASPNIIIVDSLSQFINFSRPTETEINDIYKFLNLLKTSSLSLMQDTFILLYDSKLGSMQNLPKFSVDLILKVEIAKDMPRWKD